MNRRLLALLPILLALLLGASLGGAPGHARALPIITEDQFALDANASVPGLQTTNATTIGSTITLSSTVSIAQIPYGGYRSSVHFVPGAFTLTGTSETPLGGATNCTGVSVLSDRLFDGCSRPSGTQSDTGSTFEFTVKCVVPGSNHLYLQLDSEVGAGDGTAFTDGSGNIIPPVVAGDVTISCDEPTGDSFAVDADASTPGIQPSVTALVGDNVTIGSILTAAPDAYTSYNSEISYDATKLSFVSETPTPLFTGICGPLTSQPGELQAGCGDAALAAHTETGSTATYTLQCTKPGAISLHLVTSAEVGPGVGTSFLLFSPLAYADGPTQDATVNCVVPVTKTDDVGGSAVAGGQVTYTISVDDTNESVLSPCCSSYPTPGWIVDTIPAPFTYVSDDRGCTLSGATLACPVGESQPSPDVDVTVAVPASAIGERVCNAATFVDDPSAPTPVQLGTTATDCVDVQPSTLTVHTGATHPPSWQYHAGDTITWAVGVDVTGSPATDVSVMDNATNGFTITGATGTANCTVGAITPASASFDCGTLSSADSQYLTVTGTVDADPAGLICENSAHVTASNALAVDDSDTRGCLSEDVRMVKDTDGNLAENGELANLFLGQGPLTVNEYAVNVGGDPQGVGGFEFELGYDNHIFDVDIQPTGWLYSTGRVPGAAGIGGCSASVVSENSIRFGCVSENPTSVATGCLGPDDVTVVAVAQCGVMADGSIATITLTPKPDLTKRLTPGNDNGVISTVLDQGCELADIWGHPLSSGFDALGRPIPLPGILPGGQVADCGNLTVTVRVLEGDMNTDCTVDVADDQLEAAHYGATFGSLLYDPWWDLEPALKDGDVDVKDLQKVFGRNGSTCAAPVPPQDPLPAPGDP